VRKLGKEQLQNVVLGAGLLGAGGGGSVKEGMKLVDRVMQFSDAVELITPDEADDEWWGAVIAGMGSPKASLTRVRTYSPRIALETLEKNLGIKAAFVIPFELGAGNSLNPMLAAVQKNIPMIDGDPSGRAVPEIDMTAFSLGGLPLTRLAMATEDNIRVLIDTEKLHDVERVARAVTAELQGVSAIACQAMQGLNMKKLIIPGTTTMVENIGRTLKESRESGKDPAPDLTGSHNGYLLGKGRVSAVSSETRGGFDFGVVRVEGELPLTVYFQNENMTAYREDRLIAVVPDLICALDSESVPLTNADIEKGMEITYVGFPAHPKFRTEQVGGMFSSILQALDYTGGFKPIEEVSSGG
jgi:hypothetical protein